MKYLDALKALADVETKYDVMSIRYKGLPIWIYLRIYLFDSMLDSHRAQGYSNSNIKKVIKSLFFYNWVPLFKKHNIWIIGDTADRKYIDGKYQQSITGYIPRICDDFLEIERPNNKPLHYRKHFIKEKNIISFSLIYLLSHFYEVVLRLRSVNIQNESILKQILNEYGIHFNYLYYLRYFRGQYLATRILCRIVSIPKLAVIICPYTIMGCICFLKENGVHIIEMQHGVINKNHFAYTGKFHSDEFFPDGICVFGNEEYQLFTSEQIPYCKTIHKTGLYILDESNRCFKSDIFIEERKKYKQIVVLAGQVTTDDQFIEFFLKTSRLLPDILFIYIPRGVPKIKPIEETSNLIYRAGVNIYEYLKWCDIHCTVSSTTCLEAHYFKKPTIFYNINRLAENYYSSVLQQHNGAFYVDDPGGFLRALDIINKSKFQFKQLYTTAGLEKLSNILKKYE